jgi:hypothetical protein
VKEETLMATKRDAFAELKTTKEIPILVVSIFLKPSLVLKQLGIKTRLQMEDWQHIKNLDIGELGYDYEEGLRVYVPFAKAAQAAKFFKKILLDLKAPFSGITATGAYRSNGYRDSEELSTKAAELGWKKAPLFKGDTCTLQVKK